MKSSRKKKTEVEQIEEFLRKEGFREISKEDLNELYPGKPARRAIPKKKIVASKKNIKGNYKSGK
jgi:hypothetical protein